MWLSPPAPIWVKGTVEERLFLQQELEGPFRVTHIFVHVSNIGTAHVGPSLNEVFVWIKKTCKEGAPAWLAAGPYLPFLNNQKSVARKDAKKDALSADVAK